MHANYEVTYLQIETMQNQSFPSVNVPRHGKGTEKVSK